MVDASGGTEAVSAAPLLTRVCRALCAAGLAAVVGTRSVGAGVASAAPLGARALSAAAGSGGGASVGDLLDARVGATEHRNALVAMHQRIKWDYGDLAKQVNATAAGLYEGGYGPGSRIATWLANDTEALVVTLAASKLGTTVVAIDPSANVDDVVDVLREENARGLVFGQRFSAQDRVAAVAAAFPELSGYVWGDAVRSKRLRSLRHLVNTGTDGADGVRQFTEFLVYDPQPDPLPRVRSLVGADDATVVPYSADGQRGAVVSQADLLETAVAAADALNLSVDDTVVATAGLHTRFGFAAGPLAAIHSGARLVLPAREFAAAATIKAMSTHKATAVVGSPEHIAAVAAADAGGADLSSLTKGLVEGGGASSVFGAKLASM